MEWEGLSGCRLDKQSQGRVLMKETGQCTDLVGGWSGKASLMARSSWSLEESVTGQGSVLLGGPG